ncbi:signal recognition particle-docking protein FtsY [Marinomonas mediterranea]|jgi:signal recognition particle-docking protein FtsY|uniref:Signal recognition particle receptor FtsY n=1 Tax=Marinomonas mediterranea (strain ATCC 700492 / JCM 21426 / NBRC 103028 / MMB-1) TaxID=717774 RepID=F2K019_MARM1|nr:signal recognition particle-docking protein FtsY [Marinomonas mediterranea]ADZ93233.1 signal recognition particle-docking protein FtsY [Marinomonas mediterranea MMB-1]WCN11121.1 signal recognition particle-docking protein FtsY [Marinomonas mediterranea]WCN15184.1 signal recognition particle-docking protein FtsY [Marinomonas mediterranea]WCN19228.1 signal recognition particle-docking protein FtsY [Marinomonas mediterranea MMB-1]
MEIVNQIIAFFTPYLGEYARFAPIAIGVILALLAILVKRRTVKSMDADIKSAQKKATEAQSEPDYDDQASSVDSKAESKFESQGIEEEQSDASTQSVVDTVKTVDAEPVSQKSDSAEYNQEVPDEKPTLSWRERIQSGLARTRSGLGNGLSSLVLGSKKVDDDLLEELETQLLTADVGIDATQTLIDGLTEKLNRKELKDSNALMSSLKADMNDILEISEKPLSLDKADGPFVILMVGVNGVGKTTTIGKLAKKYQAEGKSVMLAAGDTFRAAAVEQLQVWGDRNQVPVVAQHTGADSASVIYDAIESAKAKSVDVVIADTAGRLQNKANLMSELEKVVRVMKKLDVSAPHEVMLVLDAGTGQNALSQAKLFTEAVGVSGITLTKLDGTAKGGIIFAIAKQFGLPIRYIGVGEQAEDLRPFVAQEFVDALFENE